MSTLKEMVSGGKMVHFSHYRHKELWYKTDDGFEFPVPIDDIGDATFLATEKALQMMRYIRKHLDNIEAGKNS
jgi:hypothetical protein